MNVIYAVTMYSVVIPGEDSIKEAVTSSRESWELIDRVQFSNMSNARISFEGRRPMAALEEYDGKREVIFYVLTEEQMRVNGQATRIDVLDMALPTI